MLPSEQESLQLRSIIQTNQYYIMADTKVLKEKRMYGTILNIQHNPQIRTIPYDGDHLRLDCGFQLASRNRMG